jgi:hypothetical protein
LSSFVIKFGKSSSKNYDQAVDLASRHPSYEKEKEGKSVTHTVVFSDDEIESFFELFELVGRWKSTSIYIDGELVTQTNFLNCFKERTYSYSPNDYCHNKDDGHSFNDNYFGCQLLYEDPMKYNGLAGFGEMRKDGTFIVNKDKLEHYLKNNARKYGACPAFDLNKMLRLLDAIPDKINPNRDKNWEYVTEYKNGKEIAIAVRMVNKNTSGYQISDHRSYSNTKEIAAAKATSGGCATLLLSAFVIVSTILFIF